MRQSTISISEEPLRSDRTCQSGVEDLDRATVQQVMRRPEQPRSVASIRSRRIGGKNALYYGDAHGPGRVPLLSFLGVLN
jgi:predicted RNA-binding protein